MDFGVSEVQNSNIACIVILEPLLIIFPLIVLQKRRSTVLRCLASTSGFNEYQDCDNFFTGKGSLQNVKNLFKEAGKEDQ